jgi:tetratricopeptide (TPR) repeat protein
VRGEAAVAFYAVGSLANLLVASLLLLISNGAAANSPLNLLHMWGLWHGCWGLIQGIPLVPLRAGEIVHGILQPGLRMAHAGASFIFLAATAGLLGKAAAWLMPLWLLLIAGSFAKFLRRSQEHLDETIGVTAEATAAEAALSEGNFQRAIELARLGLERARSEQQRSRLGKTLAWAAIAIPDAFAAHQALSVLPSRDIEPHLVAGYLASCNRIDESIQLLEEARAAGQRSRDMTKLLIDLHYRRGRNALALTIARADADLLSDAEREAVESTLGTPEPEQQAHST